MLTIIHCTRYLISYINSLSTEKKIQFHEYNITIPNVSKFGFHGGEDNALSCGGILAFWIMDVSHIIHSISGRASKICDRTSSFSTLLRIVLTIRYQS